MDKVNLDKFRNLVAHELGRALNREDAMHIYLTFHNGQLYQDKLTKFAGGHGTESAPDLTPKGLFSPVDMIFTDLEDVQSWLNANDIQATIR
jgi:hypothetical protein